MIPIKFTQYLRPDGRQKTITISRPEGIAKMAEALKATGYDLEAEVLQTGLVSLTVVDKELEEDVEIEVTTNGPDVLAAVDRLIERAYLRV